MNRNVRRQFMKHFSILCVVFLSSTIAIADEPIVKLLDTRGRNRIVSVSSGRVTLSVPPEWSIAANSFTSMQDNFDSLDPMIRRQWRPSLLFKNVLRIERLSDYSGKQSPSSELTLVIHANSMTGAAAQKIYKEFSDVSGMEALISPKIKSKTINAHEVLFFRLAFEQIIEEHIFLQVGTDTYHFTTSESMPYSLPSDKVITLVGRIKVNSVDGDEPSDAPKDRASRIDKGNHNAGPR